MRSAFLFILSLCWNGFSYAQDTTDDYLETIIVTAARNPVSIARAGSSVTVIDRAEIERRDPSFVSDLLRDVPGLAVSQTGGPGKVTQVRVRGAEANHVLVLIDGVEANDISQADEFNFAHLTAADIERIEVVRGPQSALWGSDALAGVINIITARAEDGYEAGGSLGFGSFDTKQGRFSVGESEDRHHIRIGVSYYDTDGTNISRTGSEDDGYHNATFSLNTGVRPTDTLKLSLTGRVTDVENQSDTVDFIVTGLPIDAANETETFQAYVGTRADYDPFDGRWTHGLSGTWTLGENENFVAGGLFAGRTRGDRYKLAYQTTLRYVLPVLFDSEQATTIAVDYEHQRFEQRGLVTIFGDPNQNRHVNIAGYAIEHRITFANGLGLSGSVRYDDNSDFEDITTYRAAATYTVGLTDTTLQASYATGQKDPTFADRFGFFSSIFIGSRFIGNASLKPEGSKAWEIALYQPLFAERLIIGATFFKERLTDEIDGFVFDPVLDAFTADNLDGTSKRHGVELSVRGDLSEKLSIKASYTYLDATELDAENRRVDEVRRPRHQAAWEIAYTFAGGRGRLDLHFTHTGEQKDKFFPPFPRPEERVTLDSFNLLGLTGSFRVTDRVTLFGRLDNLLNDDYEEVLGFQTTGFGAFAGVRISTSSR